MSTFYAQEENKNQSIELPDFVITGKESISIPKIQKSRTEFIPLLSKRFFTPQYPNEEQTTIKLPEVETEVLSLGNYRQRSNALLKFSAGLETWPMGEFLYNDWNENFSYSAHLFGKNELEYVKNAGLSTAGGELGGKYVIDHVSSFLPGLEINLNGKYFYESFSYYGSDQSNLNRSTNNGVIDLTIDYLSDPYYNFGMNINDILYEQKDDEINENIFGLGAFYKIKYKNFNVKFEGNYKNQTTSSPNFHFGNEYYYNSSATIGFKLDRIFNLRAGIYFAENDGNTFFSPTAYGSVKLNKNLSFFGEFSPNTEFKTLFDFKNSNRFYQLNDFSNVFIENRFNLKFAVKYEYEKYFEISAGAGYLNSDNNYYFEDKISKGFFKIHKQDIENSYAVVNFLFRKGPFGQFYGDAKYQNVIGQNDKNIPYSSNIISNLHYAYDWQMGFGLNFGITYFSESYTDYENTVKIPESFNISASFYYELFRNFKLTLAFENILNDKYYYFKNYEAKPIDVMGGFEFRW